VPHLPGFFDLHAGIVHIRTLIAAAAPSITVEFTRAAIKQVSRLMAMYHDGDATSAQLRYRPVTSRAIQYMAGDHTLATTGMRELAIAFGLIGRGVASASWSIAPVDPDDPQSGALQIASATGSAKMFLVSGSHAVLRLIANRHMTDDEDAISGWRDGVLYPLAGGGRGIRRGAFWLRRRDAARPARTGAAAADRRRRFPL
jgi:hypothetical protein